MENSVHGNGAYMTELNGVMVSVVMVTFVQTCASFFDLQRDPNVGITYIKLYEKIKLHNYSYFNLVLLTK